MTPSADDLAVLTMLMHQGGVGVIAVYALQYLKDRDWFPWVSAHSARLNRWIGIVIALATSAGIKIAVAHNAGGGMHMGVDFPSLNVLADTVIHAAIQFGGQQVLYHTAVAQHSVNLFDEPLKVNAMDSKQIAE